MIRSRPYAAMDSAPRAKPFGEHGLLVALPISALLWLLLIAMFLIP